MLADMKLEGMDELLAEIERLGKEGSKIENNALREAGEAVKQSIQNETPTRTGKLKASISVSRVKTKSGIKQVEVGPGKDGYYGKFLEFGTVKIRANPFMSRGYETSKSEAERIIEEEIKRGLGL